MSAKLIKSDESFCRVDVFNALNIKSCADLLKIREAYNKINKSRKKDLVDGLRSKLNSLVLKGD